VRDKAGFVRHLGELEGTHLENVSQKCHWGIRDERRGEGKRTGAILLESVLELRRCLKEVRDSRSWGGGKRRFRGGGEILRTFKW